MKNFRSKLNDNQKKVLNSIVSKGEINKYQLFNHINGEISERGLSYPINNLLKNGLIRVIKEEKYADKITRVYDITFKGFIVWLSLSSIYKGLSYELNSETGENTKFPSSMEKQNYDQKEIDIIIKQGEKFSYSIFSQINKLIETYGDEAFLLLKSIAVHLFSSSPSIGEDGIIHMIFEITKGNIANTTFMNTYHGCLKSQDLKWKNSFLEGYLISLFEDLLFMEKMINTTLAKELSNLIQEKEKVTERLRTILYLFKENELFLKKSLFFKPANMLDKCVML